MNIESHGFVGNIPFIASTHAPDEEDYKGMLWIKLPEREPMIFKKGRWVPWLNPPVGWYSCLPQEENHWRFPDC